MPKNNKKKDRTTGKQNKTNKILTMKSSITPVAPRLRTKLRYSTVYNATTGTVIDQLYRLNSLFDPDESGVGTQPTGFDQLAAMYGRYRVWGVRWHARVSSTLSHGVIVNFVPSNSNTTFATPSAAINSLTLPFCKWITTSSGQRSESVRGHMNLALLNGKTHQQYIDDDTTAALVTTNPTEVLDLHMVIISQDTVTAINADITLVLEYDAEFFDPVQFTPSFFDKGHVVVSEPSESKQTGSVCSTCKH